MARELSAGGTGPLAGIRPSPKMLRFTWRLWRREGTAHVVRRGWNRLRRHRSTLAPGAYATWIRDLEGSAAWVEALDGWRIVAPPGTAMRLTTDAAGFLQRTEADVVFFDEDRLDEATGRRSAPWFKPSWSPEMMLSVDLLGACAVRDRLAADLTATGVAASTPEWGLAVARRTGRIDRFPGVCIHRDRHPAEAGERGSDQAVAVRDHLAALGLADPTVREGRNGTLRVAWRHDRPRVSIVIPTRDRLDLLRPCIDSILSQTDYPDYEVILVDTGSGAEALAYERRLADEHERVHVVPFHDDFNYSAANNTGVRQATGDVLVFLNNDVEVLHNDWLGELVMWATRADIGCVGAQLLYPDGRIQHAGAVMGLGIVAGHLFAGAVPGMQEVFGSTQWYRNVLAVTGACLAVRRHVYDEVGGFDEEYRISYSDAAFCLAVRDAGYRNLYDPHVELIHKERQSRSSFTDRGDDERGLRLLRPYILHGDPYYHPGLSTAFTLPTLLRKGEETSAERAAMFLPQLAHLLGDTDS